MVLSARVGALMLLLASGCIGTTPPQRLAVATPIVMHVQLESASGEPIAVPTVVTRELAAALAARNLQPSEAPENALGSARTTAKRVVALLQATATGATPWVLLVEARARFFSQLSGRYRWEVELRTSLVPRDDPAAVQTSDLSVAAFLSFEHEREADALLFVRRQLVDDVGALVDRVLATRSH